MEAWPARCRTPAAGPAIMAPGWPDPFASSRCSPSSPPRSPAATSPSSRSARRGSSRSAGSACRSPPATRARSTSTSRSWTGARASSRSASPPACASTCAPSTAARCERVAQGAPLDVGDVRVEARDAIAGFLRALIAVVCLAGLALGVLTAFAVRHQHSAATALDDRGVGGDHGRDRRRARRPAPAARRDRQAAVLRLRRRHPARAGRRGHRAALRPRAGPGARRAARRPRPPGHRARGPRRDRGPAADHDRLRPAQQRARAADPRARGGRRAGASSPATSPTAARRWRTSCSSRITRIGKPFVFVTGQPRLRPLRAASSPRRRGGADRARAAQARRRLRPGDQRGRRACAWPATATRSSGRRRRLRGPLHSTSRRPRRCRRSRDWFEHDRRTTSTSCSSTSRR